MYHGVVKNDATFFSPRHIDAKQFERQIKYLTDNFEIITPNIAFEYYRNGKSPSRKSIVITFDDGYQNNLDIALPILAKYNAQATFFISGTCVENKEINILWPDLIQLINYTSPSKTIQVNNIKYKNFIELELKQNIFDIMKKMSKVGRDSTIEQLSSLYDIKTLMSQIDPHIYKLLTAPEIRKLSKSKIVTIGSHGYGHYNLANIHLTEAVEDMKKSKNVLENVIQKNIIDFAYPDGNYNQSVLLEAQKLGFVNQFTVNYLREDDNTDINLMDRHGISSTTTYASNICNLVHAFKSKGH